MRVCVDTCLPMVGDSVTPHDTGLVFYLCQLQSVLPFMVPWLAFSAPPHLSSARLGQSSDSGVCVCVCAWAISELFTQ